MGMFRTSPKIWGAARILKRIQVSFYTVLVVFKVAGGHVRKIYNKSDLKFV